MPVIDLYNDFLAVLNDSRNFDNQNQTLLQNASIDSERIAQLTEGLFFKVYRSYENYIENIFLSYARQQSTDDGTPVISYLRPKDHDHSRELITSSMPFLDWNSPDTVIKRAETYLENGFPVKDVYTTYKATLTTYRRFRNHYAHNSEQSLREFKKEIIRHYNTLPLQIPSLGEYLLITVKNDQSRYYLQKFFDDLEAISFELKR